eukprot:scaffold114639_cov60-Phaeocystis_antarctica.AAC.4
MPGAPVAPCAVRVPPLPPVPLCASAPALVRLYLALHRGGGGACRFTLFLSSSIQQCSRLNV